MNWAPTVKVCEDLASQDRDSYCKILELGCCQVWISKISLPPLDHKVVDELREMKEKVWGAWRPLGTIVSYLGVWYMLIKFLIASVAAWLRLCDDGMNNLYCTFQRWTFVWHLWVKSIEYFIPELPKVKRECWSSTIPGARNLDRCGLRW